MNSQLIPILPEGSVLRTEAEGGIFISGKGFFSTVSASDLDLLKEIDGCETAYAIAKRISISDSDLACNLIRVMMMTRDGIITLGSTCLEQPRKARLAQNLPFAADSFSTPVMVSLAVTDACNRECRHCYREGVSCGQALGRAEYSAVIETLSKMDIALLNITGGEPFLFEHTVDLAVHAASMVNSVTISTNGILLDRAILRSLGQGGVRNLQIGLNAVYDSGPDLDRDLAMRVFDAIRTACEEGIRVTVGVVLTCNTIGDLDTIFKLSSKSGASSIRLGPLMNVHPGCSTVQTTPTEVMQASLLAEKLSNETGIPVQFVDGLGNPSDTPVNSQERRHFCYLGTGILHIEPDGSLYPCSALLSDEFRLGAVSGRTTISELRNTWRESPILNSIRKVTVDRLDHCRDCDIKAQCGGGCRTAAYWNTGSITGENPFCQIVKGYWAK